MWLVLRVFCEPRSLWRQPIYEPDDDDEEEDKDDIAVPESDILLGVCLHLPMGFRPVGSGARLFIFSFLSEFPPLQQVQKVADT